MAPAKAWGLRPNAPAPAKYCKFRDLSRPQIWIAKPPVEAWQPDDVCSMMSQMYPVSEQMRSRSSRAASDLDSMPCAPQHSTASWEGAPSSECQNRLGHGAPPPGTQAGRATPSTASRAKVQPDYVPLGGRATPSAPSQPSRGRMTPRPASSLAGPAESARRSRAEEVQASPKAQSLVQPPWGRERANIDNPSWDVAKVRQMEYRQMLDEQNSKKADLRRKRDEESSEMDKICVPSLSTRTHEWGAPAHDVIRQKALMQEHKTVAAQRKGKELEHRKKEETNCRAWLEESARDRAERYIHGKIRQKEELSELTSEWKTQAEEKRRQRDEQRRAELQAEREAIIDITDGMRPQRRLRKPRSSFSNVPASSTPRTAR
eukprot:gb/GFBE01021207.1/.p1 GENE.gb/GFBE01021207.1/~~gb/GFBE01021207.1/.p1  ORF type:complete len:375 (+),score=60.75 gb/GFBE01021207.1/:1-1125(+)